MSDRPHAIEFFDERFGLDAAGLEGTLAGALGGGIDYADVFCEYSVSDSVVLEEGIVKQGDRHVEQGVGIRAQSGE
ncbi:MAG: DNA gyrase modulator, partial [Myxococcota bacterium]